MQDERSLEDTLMRLFCNVFLERELFLLFLHTRIEGEREAEITSCDSASVLCNRSIALGSIKSKKKYYTY